MQRCERLALEKRGDDQDDQSGQRHVASDLDQAVGRESEGTDSPDAGGHFGDEFGARQARVINAAPAIPSTTTTEPVTWSTQSNTGLPPMERTSGVKLRADGTPSKVVARRRRCGFSRYEVRTTGSRSRIHSAASLRSGPYSELSSWGVTMILQCSSGSPRVSKAPATPSRPTLPVTIGPGLMPPAVMASRVSAYSSGV